MERKCSDITLSFKKEFEVDWNSYVLWSNLIDFVYPNVKKNGDKRVFAWAHARMCTGQSTYSCCFARQERMCQHAHTLTVLRAWETLIMLSKALVSVKAVVTTRGQ